jgi:uncharacterized protein YbjT (DUF2867 family)
LRETKIGWVVLRPGLFMQNTFAQAAAIKNDGKLVSTAPPDMPMAFIDVRDTGAVGARVLVDPAPHAGKTYEFTGKRISYREFAELFSQVLGKKVNYVQVTVDQTEQALKARGMPDWLVTHLRFIAKLTLDGAFSNENTKLIEDLLKRPPITARQFVEDHKAAFA